VSDHAMGFSLSQVNLPASCGFSFEACATNDKGALESSLLEFMPFYELLEMLANESSPLLAVPEGDSETASEFSGSAKEKDQLLSACEPNPSPEAVALNQQIALSLMLHDTSYLRDRLAKRDVCLDSDILGLSKPEDVGEVAGAIKDDVKNNVPEKASSDVTTRYEPLSQKGADIGADEAVLTFLSNDRSTEKINNTSEDVIKGEPTPNLPDLATNAADLSGKDDEGFGKGESRPVDDPDGLVGKGQKGSPHLVDGLLKYAPKKHLDENIGGFRDSNNERVDPSLRSHPVHPFRINEGLDIPATVNEDATPVYLKNYTSDEGVKLKQGLNAVISLMRREGVDTARITVHPPELGHIDVDLDIARDGGLRAAFKVEGSNVANLLTGQLDSLRQTLNASGFQVLGLDVYVKGQGEERDQHRGESNHGRQKTKSLEAVNGKDIFGEMAFELDVERGLLQWIA